jgi:sialic acid synthase SpsE
MIIKNFNTDEKVMIVAEIGNNHEGDFELAKKMVLKAAECGVDAVKFQTIIPEELVSPDQTARLETLRRFRFSYEQFAGLSDIARKTGVLFITTPFSLSAVTAMTPHVDAFKISSGDNTFFPLIDSVIAAGKPLIVSTGLIDMNGVEYLYNYLKERISKDRFALLHCACAYPVPDAQANLGAIIAMSNQIPCAIGYSDHTLGIDASVLAVAAGARIIEKHFTLDKNYSEYRDHQLSADPGDLKLLVSRIRQAGILLGQISKISQPCEGTNVKAVRRSIVAGHDLHKGHIISMADFSWLRPGGGLPPGQEGSLIGKKLKHDISSGKQLSLSDIE